MKFLLLALSILFVAGCSTTSGLNPEFKKSGFDGVGQVSIMPHGAACKTMQCPTMGALWLENNPNQVGLRFQVVNDLSTIKSTQLSIDGQIYNFENLNTTDISYYQGFAKSGMVAISDYSIIDKILKSQKTWIRISTSNGYVEAVINDNGKDSKAFNALKRFNNQVIEKRNK